MAEGRRLGEKVLQVVLFHILGFSPGLALKPPAWAEQGAALELAGWAPGPLCPAKCQVEVLVTGCQETWIFWVAKHQRCPFQAEQVRRAKQPAEGREGWGGQRGSVGQGREPGHSWASVQVTGDESSVSSSVRWG